MLEQYSLLLVKISYHYIAIARKYQEIPLFHLRISVTMLQNMFLLCFGAYTFAHSLTRRAPRLTYRHFGFKHAMPMRAKNIRNREMWHFLGVGVEVNNE